MTKTELYVLIRDDYLNCTDKRESFIYTYLREKKNERAAKNAESRESYDAYRSGNSRKDTYIALRSAYIAAFREDPIITKEDYAAVLDSISSKKKRKASSGDPREAEEEYEYNILLDQISSIFYNAGFRQKEVKPDPNHKDVKEGRFYRNKYENETKPANYLDDIDMMSGWEEYVSVGRTDSPTSSEIYGAEYIKKCDELYELLLKNGMSKVFVPLAVDPLSDMGVFIVGNEYTLFDYPVEDSGDETPCYICTAIFEELSDREEDNDRLLFTVDENNGGIVSDSARTVSSLLEDDEAVSIRTVMSMTIHKSVNKAFEHFNNIRSGKIPGKKQYNGYTFINDLDAGTVLPDERFKDYFRSPAQKKTKSAVSLTERIMARQAEQEKKNTDHLRGVSKILEIRATKDKKI